MDPIDAQIRQVFFFDTPDLALYQAAWSCARAGSRRKADDAVVKLRPVVPDALSRQAAELPGFGVEVDAMPGGFVCSGRLKRARRRRPRQGGHHGRPADPQALQQGAARALRRPRARRHRARRPRCSARSSCSSFGSRRRASTASWSPSCGCTRTTPACWSCPRSASRPRRSTSPRRRARTSTGAGRRPQRQQEAKTRRALEYFSARHQPARPVRQRRPRARPQPA